MVFFIYYQVLIYWKKKHPNCKARDYLRNVCKLLYRFADFVIVVLGCVSMNNNGYSDCMGQKTDTCSCSHRAHVLSPRKLGFYWFIPIVDMEVAKISHVFKNCLNLLIVVGKIIMKNWRAPNISDRTTWPNFSTPKDWCKNCIINLLVWNFLVLKNVVKTILPEIFS